MDMYNKLTKEITAAWADIVSPPNQFFFEGVMIEKLDRFRRILISGSSSSVISLPDMNMVSPFQKLGRIKNGLGRICLLSRRKLQRAMRI